MIRADTKETDRSNRRYIAASMEAPLLERQQEADLARAWLRDRDEAALHEIIESHARLVVRIAVGFRGSGLPLGDLVQEGNIGLMEAADRFDPERNVRFSTYASWWIVAAIQNFLLRNASIVRAATTPRLRRLFFNLRRLRARRATGFGGALSGEDREIIARALNVTVAEVEKMEVHVSRPDQSLNAPVGEDGTLEQQDLLPDFAPDPESLAAKDGARAARRAWVDRAMQGLSQRERRIVASRFLGERRTTLAEIGREFGVSKERIRQIEGRALTKMRAVLSELVEEPGELFDN